MYNRRQFIGAIGRPAAAAAAMALCSSWYRIALCSEG